MVDYSVLRENDIRGVYGKNITKEFAYTVGAAFGTYLIKRNKTSCIVGYDNRLSGEELVLNLMKGLKSTGIHIKFLGMCTTAFLNYATMYYNIEAGVIVTASHNPKEENGFKLFGDEFLHLRRNELEVVYDLIKTKEFVTGIGSVEYVNIRNSYINMLGAYIRIGDRRLKVAIDAGNGTTSIYIKDIIKNYNIDPIFINCESDGSFPHHNPDPNVDDNLKELKKTVVEENCDFGMAFDGDGDRIGIVDEMGNTIESDKLIAIFARHIIPKNVNKKVILDVKCSQALEEDVLRIGGTPIMVKNGSAYIETVLKDKNVLIGGEYSGHIFFRDKYYGYDDGIYAGLRVFEILSNTDKKCSELLSGYNKYFNTPEIKVATTDDKKWDIVSKVKEYVKGKAYEYLDIDGVRVKFNDGWALIRCSNTGPNITMRFEAKTESRLNEIKNEFSNLVNSLL